MDLYDDLDTKTKASQDGWSSGIKMLQTQLQAKKAQAQNSFGASPHNSQLKKPSVSVFLVCFLE